MKGYTRIELIDPKTSRVVRKTESENMVTNACNKLLESNPYLYGGVKSNTRFGETLPPIVDHLFGGLLLFNKPLKEGVDDYRIPEGNKMIGNARVHFASTEAVPELGVYNAEESEFKIEGGVGTRKYVYDFSTSKANGTISAIALTNHIAGFIGCGNSSGKRDFRANAIDPGAQDLRGLINPNRKEIGMIDKLYLPPDVSLEYGLKPDKFLLANYKKNFIAATHIYSFYYTAQYLNVHLSSGKIPVYKYYFPFSSVNPISYCGDRLLTCYERLDITVPEEIKSLGANYVYHSLFTNDDGAYILMSKTQSVTPEGAFYLWFISADLTTSKAYTLKNTTKSNILTGGAQNGTQSIFAVYGEYIILNTYDIPRKVFKMKINEPTDVTEITLPEGGLKDFLFFLAYDGKNISGDDTSQYLALMLDLNENVARFINGSRMMNAYTQDYAICKCAHLNFRIGRENSMKNFSTLVPNVMMLSTINNLDEPVVKTADLAMKITYTLTAKMEP